MRVLALMTVLLCVLGGWALAGAAPSPAGPASRPAFPDVDGKTLEAFHADCAAAADLAEKNEFLGVPTKFKMVFFGPELRHLSAGKFWGPEAAKVSKAGKPENADPLPAIVDFKQQLDKLGIELLVMPVPAKAAIYPEFISPSVPSGAAKALRVDLAHQEFYRELARQGVAVIDLAPVFLAAKIDVKQPGDIYCQTDTHWSGLACQLAAATVKQALRDRPWFQSLKPRSFTATVRETEITGDLWKALGDPAAPKEKLLLRYVSQDVGGQAVAVEPDKESPIVLLGDSHNLVFHIGGDMHAKGAGLADQLALELGTPLDVIGVRGSGATPARINLLRRARADDTYLARKKLVIWCFSVRELTESSGWAKVPIVKSE